MAATHERNDQCKDTHDRHERWLLEIEARVADTEKQLSRFSGMAYLLSFFVSIFALSGSGAFIASTLKWYEVAERIARIESVLEVLKHAAN